MSNFKYSFTPLLEILLEASEKGLISSNEKLRIKQLINLENKKFIKIFEEFKFNKDKHLLIMSLKEFLYSEQLSPSNNVDTTEKGKENYSILNYTDNSSPIGQDLRIRKRQIQKVRNKTEIQNKIENDFTSIKPLDLNLSNSVKNCDHGRSPHINYGSNEPDVEETFQM